MIIRAILCSGLILIGLLHINAEIQPEQFRPRLQSFILNVIVNCANDIDDTNIVLSPFALWTTMDIMAEAAEGSTLTELQRFLRFKRIDKRRMRAIYSHMEGSFNIKSPGVELEASNALFVDSNINMNGTYADVLKNIYHVNVHRADMKSNKSIKKINGLVAKYTNNQIKEIIGSDDINDGNMIITNAIFFKGDWSHPFDIAETKKRQFFDKNGKALGYVNMMKQKGPYLYLNHKELESELVELPYGKEKNLCMIVILPKKGVDVKNVLIKFEKIHLKQIFDDLDKAASRNNDIELNIHLPRFSITSDLVMNKILMKLGVYETFDPSKANFGSVSPDKEVFLSRLIHKVKLDVVEKSVQSVIGIFTRFGEESSESKIPEDMIIDRPFVFLILEKKNGLILLGGSYVKPELV